jgi:hypothetical protein
MTRADEKIVAADVNEKALMEFEVSVRRSIKQVDAGLVKSFKNKEEFLSHLNNLE